MEKFDDSIKKGLSSFHQEQEFLLMYDKYSVVVRNGWNANWYERVRKKQKSLITCDRVEAGGTSWYMRNTCDMFQYNTYFLGAVRTVPSLAMSSGTYVPVPLDTTHSVVTCVSNFIYYPTTCRNVREKRNKKKQSDS